MKITKSQLKKIVKEEHGRVLKENEDSIPHYGERPDLDLEWQHTDIIIGELRLWVGVTRDEKEPVTIMWNKK